MGEMGPKRTGLLSCKAVHCGKFSTFLFGTSVQLAVKLDQLAGDDGPFLRKSATIYLDSFKQLPFGWTARLVLEYSRLEEGTATIF